MTGKLFHTRLAMTLAFVLLFVRLPSFTPPAEAVSGTDAQAEYIETANTQTEAEKPLLAVLDNRLPDDGISDDSPADTYTVGFYQFRQLMNFRASPGTDAERVYTDDSKTTPLLIPANATLRVTDIRDDWGYARYNGRDGWVLLTYSNYIAGFSEPTTDEFMAVDLSQWQPAGSVNFNSLRNAGVEAVILRIGGRYYNTTGNGAIYSDDAFHEHYKAAKAAGLAIGGYFYSYALTAEGAAEEAQYCITTLEAAGCLLDMPVFIDIEEYNGTTVHYTAGREVCSLVVDSFCATLENAGYYAGFYSNCSFAKALIAPEVLEGRAVWIAHYSESCDYPNYHMWQYMSTGRLDGYDGPLDLNVCYRDFPSFIRQNGFNGYEAVGVVDKVTYAGHTAGDWVLTHEASCTEYGVRTRTCTDEGCGRLLVKETVKPLGHHLSQSVVPDLSLLAGQNMHGLTVESYDLTMSGNATLGYELLTTKGGSLVTYCTRCGVITKCILFAADNTCQHRVAMNNSVYRTDAYMYFRQGPSTTYATVTDGAAASVIVPTGTTLSVLWTFSNWGYTYYGGSYGWVMLDFSTCVSEEELTAPQILTAAACTQDGVQQGVCETCGVYAYSAILPATGHSSAGSVYQDGTCLVPSSINRACSSCTQELYYRVSSPGSHAFTTTIQREPTETVPGQAHLLCGVCGQYATVSLPSASMFDLDGDGSCSSADARLALRFAVGLDSEKLTADIIKRGDVDNSGSLSAADARYLLRLTVELESRDELLIRYYAL